MTIPAPRTVAIVLDPAFASRLPPLAERAAVWIVDSQENRPAIEALWTARRTRGAMYDVTVFRMIPGLTPEQHVGGVMRSVEMRPESDEPAAATGAVEVHGAALTDAMRSTFEAYDYRLLDPLDDGFRARRGHGEVGTRPPPAHSREPGDDRTAR